MRGLQLTLWQMLAELISSLYLIPGPILVLLSKWNWGGF